jgi:hypothetical protein
MYPFDGRSFVRRLPSPGIDQPLLPGAAVDEDVDKSADFCRQMMAMRIDRADRQFHWPVVRKQTNKSTRFEIAGDKKARRQTDAGAVKRRQPQHLAAVGEQVACDRCDGGRALAVDKMPSVLKWIMHVRNAIVVGEFGQLLRRSVLFEIARRAAQHVTPLGEAAYDEV